VVRSFSRDLFNRSADRRRAAFPGVVQIIELVIVPLWERCANRWRK
jgi:hypothetical protein